MGLEPTYAGSATPSTYTLLAELPQIKVDFMNDGARALDARTGGELQRTRQSGQSHAFPVKVQTRGAGTTAFGAGVTPIDTHILRRIAGLAATFTPGASGAPGTWGYKLSSGPKASAVTDSFTHGERYRTKGVYAKSWTIEAESNGLITETAELVGIGVDPVDALPPDQGSFDVTATNLKFDGAFGGASVFGVAGTAIRKFSLKVEYTATARPAGNVAGGHLGYTLSNPVVSGSITVENPARTDYDFDAALRTGAIVPLNLTIGSDIDGGRAALISQNLQLTELTREAEGGNSLLTCAFKCFGGADGYSQFEFRQF